MVFAGDWRRRAETSGNAKRTGASGLLDETAFRRYNDEESAPRREPFDVNAGAVVKGVKLRRDRRKR